MNGALLVHKHEGISSFGIIELLQRDWRHVHRTQYFLGAKKTYEGVMRFGETTVPGDATAPISATSNRIPDSLNALQSLAQKMSLQPYLQVPPMHSAKKQNGQPLYKLARAGIEVQRNPKLCQLYEFEFLDYQAPRATFRLQCSSGTYVRTLTQDFAHLQDTVALLEKLHRTASGPFQVSQAWTVHQISQSMCSGLQWPDLKCWIPFDQLLIDMPAVQATPQESTALSQGKQEILSPILNRMQSLPDHSPHSQEAAQEGQCIAIYCAGALVAIARNETGTWRIERVFNAVPEKY
jgi:tRNA pseudouridine55 synthase